MMVMPALVAGIHVLQLNLRKDVDGRDKPGHDEPWASHSPSSFLAFSPAIAAIVD